ncbi:MAG TPA: ureidoglycolate lyase [Spirochaetia bacterium]|nr:ureidoglycolate lyase [Spirochaetia bacterium]
MKTVEYEKLSTDAFARFGSYAGMINPTTERIGAEPIEFFRDIVQSSLGTSTTASFGVCRVGTRPFVIDVSEYHDGCCETLMPIDGDVLIHVAPAVPAAEFPFGNVRVFLVPQGTLVCLRPGVWHHGPYTLSGKPVNCLVALPERTYMVDCKTFEFPRAQWITITGVGIEKR